ncbi:MAG: response regulator [Deltaproteobacteria bacterium]|nr:response regulator [Deltaproteobacteria bacterium]
MKQVRGVLFLDYVRMLRKSASQNLARHLQPADLDLLSQQVDLGAWYSMDVFERFGLAILAEVVGGEVDSVRLWGRSQIPQILSFFPELCADGDVRDTIIRFANLMGSLFDYPAVTVEDVSDEHATIGVAYGMGSKAEEAASWQTFGFFEALVEQAGGEHVHGKFTRMSWKDSKTPTRLDLEWRRPGAPAAKAKRLPRLLLVDDEHLVREGLERLLAPVAEVTAVESATAAIAALESRSFDLVMSDHALGGGPNGLDLLRQVAERWPKCARVLHTSAPPDEAMTALARGVLHSVAEKPITAAELRSLLAELFKS